ncbi:uncharacterized protein LY89DRAFT_721741 [Mollisia scopiformis]|uniref:DUF6536 domain-containing protein n=1 Tax=Mollisia scopiformis TaxID=149040 RepID=A0A194WY66_MOLSC|nr:uncharacterized protein LY89DRAFT_721741 [Mollisia scopiformis]KUJ12911.1 hypothetical protein LY89DRAFT_721741 [Mollisia scopiformis]
MATQRYSQLSRTPLTENDGDLASSSAQHEDTSDYAHSQFQAGGSDNARHVLWGESYELDDRRSAISSAPLLQQNNAPTKKSSVMEPEIKEDPILDGQKRRLRPSGWKAGVRICAATAATICILNAILAIWAVANHEHVDGLSYLYTGGCKEVAKMNFWIHLGINAMSAILLSGSNYTMQVIGSPTRRDVNDAHTKRRWLDIGILSTRNLRAISWGRIALWTILGLSSVSIHLMYSTVIFSSLSANFYDYIVVTKDFLEPMHESYLDGRLTNYTSTDCIAMYGIRFVSKAFNVLLVTGDTGTSNNSVLAAGAWGYTIEDIPGTAGYEVEIPYSWICGDSWDEYPYQDRQPVCTTAVAKAAASSPTGWIVANHRISYCMVELVEEECQLNFSLSIMLIVIAFNVLKACLMILTALKINEPTLVTIGDAIASFLQEPDPTTEGLCLSNKIDFQNKKWALRTPKQWKPKKHFWFRPASVKRWLTCNILGVLALHLLVLHASLIRGRYIGFVCLGVDLLVKGMKGISIYNLKLLWELGFGAVDFESTLNVETDGLIATTLLANLPQGILAFLYLTYNSLFSCMLGAFEWNRFARFSKPLRVSAPQGKQRSTYYLQLPYTYAIPLLIMSICLHWLLSESLFLVRVNIRYGPGGSDSRVTTIGYSCIAIFCALIIGGVTMLCSIAVGFRQYDDGIPLVGSCSAAISAACHPPKEDSMVHLKAVK